MDKCGRCGWKHGGFHICVDLSVPHPQETSWERYKQKRKLKDGAARKRKFFDNVPGSFNDMPNWGGTRDHATRWRG